MSKLIKSIPINKNLKDGDCGLWFNVIAFTKRGFVNHVCPYSKCKTWEDAIRYYFKTYYYVGHIPLGIEHHKYPAFDLSQLAKAC